MNRQAMAARPARRRTSAFPTHLLPVIVVAYCCLLPREMAIDLAGVELRPYRLAMIAMLPITLRQLIENPIKWTLADSLAAFASSWFFIAMLGNSDLESALVVGLAQGADFALAYFTGRAAIRSLAEFRYFLIMVLPGFVIMGLLMALESLTHTPLVRPLVARLMGLPPPNLYEEVRFGLMRASAAFPHPILGGTLMASILPLAWYIPKRPRNRGLGMFVAFCSFFAVSSTAILNLAMNIGLIAADLIQRITRWPIFMIGAMYATILAIGTQLYSESGLFSVIIRRLTFNAGSGRYRLQIWDYAGQEAMNHPWFGIGMRPYERPSWMISETIDAQWLLLATRYGLPLAAAALLLLVGTAGYLIYQFRNRETYERGIGFALAFSLFSLVFSAFSVALWEGVLAWTIMLAGIGMSLATSLPRTSPSHRTMQGRRGSDARDRLPNQGRVVTKGAVR